MARDYEVIPFSVRLFSLESAVRFAYFAVEEAHHCRNKLFSMSLSERKEGQNSAIRLLRTMRAQVLDYQKSCKTVYSRVENSSHMA